MALKRWTARAVWGMLLGSVTALQGQLQDGSLTKRGLMLSLLSAAIGALARAMQDGSPWDEQ